MRRSSQPLRPLLPAENPTSPRDNAETTSSSDLGIPKRIPTKAACEACRKRKSKCSGDRPACMVCRERNTACQYVTLPTETHNVAQRRRMVELESASETYEKLYNLLRTRQEDEAIDILKRIRSGVDMDTIVNMVQEGDLLLQVHHRPESRYPYEFPYKRDFPLYLRNPAWPNPYLDSALLRNFPELLFNTGIRTSDLQTDKGEHKQPAYSMPYHAIELVDSGCESIDVTKWTAVPASNTMLRTLLEIYFIFEYPFHSYFHKDLFLSDMRDGVARFCSPLLVNAVLAAAWHGYLTDQTRADFWMPANLGYRFLAEAQRLLGCTDGVANITTIQAAGIMSMIQITNGLDELSWPLLSKSIKMAQELALFSPTPDSSPVWQNAAAITAWGLFNAQALQCYHMHRTPLLTHPPSWKLPSPKEDPTYYGEITVRYPNHPEPINLDHSHVFWAMSSFRVILNDVALEVSQSEHKILPLHRAFDIRERLRDWHLDLPDGLAAGNISFPCQLKLHMHLHVLLISIFEPYENQVHTSLSSGAQNPSQVVSQAKACLETLVRMYYLRHGFELYDPTIVVYVSLLAWAILRDYKQPGATDPAHMESKVSTLVLCAKLFWEQGRNSCVSEAIFWYLKDSLPTVREVMLLREFAVTNVEEETKRISRLVQEVRSEWPVGIFSAANASIEDSRLGQFVRQREATLKSQSRQTSTKSSRRQIDGTFTTENE